MKRKFLGTREYLKLPFNYTSFAEKNLFVTFTFLINKIFKSKIFYKNHKNNHLKNKIFYKNHKYCYLKKSKSHSAS